MNVTIVTTADEDAAILALTAQAATVTRTTPETVVQFIDRIVRHQVDFAVRQAKEAVQAQYDKLDTAAKAEIDAILDREKAKREKP